MKILSLDVGIKNLAFCVLERKIDENNFKILKWDIINISCDEVFNCQVSEKNKPCDKPAKFKKNNCYYCLKHSKRESFCIPTADLKLSFINKQKIQSLINIADKYKIAYEKPSKKANIISQITDYVHNKCFEEIKGVKCSDVDLITIGKNIKIKFDDYFKEYECFDYVIIENQISPIANRMKTIQGMIAQYFIMNNKAKQIEFVSAINKLKNTNTKNNKVVANNTNVTNGLNDATDANDTIVSNDVNKSNKDTEKPNNINDKKQYKDRKNMGINKCLELLNTDFKFDNMLEHFNSHKKKDDLADCFLQGIWFINNKIE